MPRQPPLDRGVFVGGLVVGDPRQGLVLRNLPINQPEEPPPFLVPMAGSAGGEQGALCNMESGKERSGAVALVVIGHRPAPTFLQREAGLRAIERLDLAFLIDGQDHRMLRRMQLESHHIR